MSLIGRPSARAGGSLRDAVYLSFPGASVVRVFPRPDILGAYEARAWTDDYRIITGRGSVAALLSLLMHHFAAVDWSQPHDLRIRPDGRLTVHAAPTGRKLGARPHVEHSFGPPRRPLQRPRPGPRPVQPGFGDGDA